MREAGDIAAGLFASTFRARFRNSFERPKPVPANKVLKYAIDLHTNAHAFLKGHRIRVRLREGYPAHLPRRPRPQCHRAPGGSGAGRVACSLDFNVVGLPVALVWGRLADSRTARPLPTV